MSRYGTSAQQNQIHAKVHGAREDIVLDMLDLSSFLKQFQKHLKSICRMGQSCERGQASRGKCDLSAVLHPLSKHNPGCLQHSLFTDASSMLETLYLHSFIASPSLARTDTADNNTDKTLLLLVKLMYSSWAAGPRLHFLCKKIPAEIPTKKGNAR